MKNKAKRTRKGGRRDRLHYISARMCVWCHASKVPVTFTRSRYHLQIVLTITKCLSRHISGIFVCYSLSIWLFPQSYETADSPNSQYIEFSIEVFSLSPAATRLFYTIARYHIISVKCSQHKTYLKSLTKKSACEDMDSVKDLVVALSAPSCSVMR